MAEEKGKKQYLYGAAVQGIQDFIYQTNELKDIVGASELVDAICTTAFDEFADGDDSHSIVRAAGNIKYLFTDEATCAKAVRDFPKKVQLMAPGITISQAVVEMDGAFSQAVDELESKLRTQRNRPVRSATWGLQGVRRSRKTGQPAVKMEKGEYQDKATVQKRKMNNVLKVCEKAFGHEVKAADVAFDIEDITSQNDWIAIIHADGNGLGKVIQKVGGDMKQFAAFSRELDELTQSAAVQAYEKVMEGRVGEGRIPLRPVVLSGDDLTVIIRGDLAVPYTKAFLKHFEEKTTQSEVIKGAVEEGKGLTACAGIAFIKSSYPFYYGYQLAEDLCNRAKKRAKAIHADLAPSCLMFHKLQDSFVESYEEIAKRELTPCAGHTFEFGPYFLNEQAGYWTINDLEQSQKELESEEGNAVKSHLRQWVGLIYKADGLGKAKQKQDRLENILSNGALKKLVSDLLTGVKIENGDNKVPFRYPVYDVLALHAITNQTTR